MIYLVDIDGTLADLSHRLHYIQQKPADWSGFFAACPADAPIPEVIKTVNLLHNAGAMILFVTGRSDEVEKETVDWIHKYVRCDGLYMRRAGDHREDSVVKSEILDKIRSDYPEWEIVGVFEDRKQVVDMYRSKGLRVFQVAEGNF